MPPANYKGVGDRYTVMSAPGTYTVGLPLVAEGHAGVPLTSGLAGTRFDMMTEGIFAFAAVGGVARGDLIYITAATGALTATAGVGNRPFGKVQRIPGDEGVPTGIMWVRIAPFTYAVTA